MNVAERWNPSFFYLRAGVRQGVADEGIVTAPPMSKQDLRERAFRTLNQLPPFSPTLSRLLASLAKEDVFLKEIATIIEKDTVLTGHVLKLVNSALYARSGTINSVRHAVSILGLNKLRNVALSLSVARMWKMVKTPKTWPQGAFNLHSVATAVMADQLAQRVRVRYPEGAFTAGLLHAVGKLMIAIGLPEHYDMILATYQGSSELTMEEAEYFHIGCRHTELGAAALGEWKLPADIQRAVGNQSGGSGEEDGEMDLGGLLLVAHKVVNRLGVMIPACASLTEGTAEEVLAEAGLKEEAGRILLEFQNEFGAMRAFF